MLRHPRHTYMFTGVKHACTLNDFKHACMLGCFKHTYMHTYSLFARRINKDRRSLMRSRPYKDVPTYMYVANPERSYIHNMQHTYLNPSARLESPI